jgi:predicted phage terminase large subunit-like protein
VLTADVIEGFVGSVLASRFDGAVRSPKFHQELWEYATSKYKYVAIAAPRGHAKSTAGTMAYGLASALFRQSRFIVIVSDTEAQSTFFLGNIKTELQENPAIAQLFDLKKNEKGDVFFVKDTETDIIVQFNDGHKFRMIAKGAEQKLRGLNWNGTRPDLIICDDLENDELVMNKDRRDKLRRWFSNALLPCLSPNGKFRMWGTILHMDSLLESVMPREYERDTIEEDGIKVHKLIVRGNWKTVKYRAHNKDFSKILWPERFSQEFLESERAFRIQQGIPDSYSQEYLNNPIDESVAYFKKSDFQAEKHEEKEERLTYYVTADLAISEKETADYSVFVVAGMNENRVLKVVNVIRDRMDGKEIVDIILTLQRAYEPTAFGIEEMQVSKAIKPFLREEMISQNTFPNLVEMKHGGKDKIQRARSIQARMRAKTVKFRKDEDWYDTFEDEALKFPRGKHDDQVDAFAYMGMLLDKMIEAPTKEELEEEEYEDDYREYSSGGRSALTGY